MTDCIEWAGNRHDRGYGRFWSRGRNRYIRAHRWVWEHAHGPIPDGMVVMHSCDNPSCVNADHLSVGTHADNMADMKAKGRARSGGKGPPKGTKPPNTRLNHTDVVHIKTRLRDGESAASIARDYGMTRQGVGRIKRGQAWAEVVI